MLSLFLKGILSKFDFFVYLMHDEVPDYTIFICKFKTDECFSFMKRF